MIDSCRHDGAFSVSEPSLLRHEASGISTICIRNRWIASAHEDSSIKIWHLDTRKIVHTIASTCFCNEVVTSMSWLTDAKMLATAGGTIYEIGLTSLENNDSTQDYASSTTEASRSWLVAKEEINSMAIDRHDHIWVGDDSGRLTVLDHIDGKVIAKQGNLKHEYICTSVCRVGCTKSSIISGGLDCLLKEWDDRGRLQNQLNVREVRIATQEMLTSFNPPYIYCIVSSPISRNVLYIGLGDAAILKVKLTGVGRRKEWHTEALEGHCQSVGTLAILGDDSGLLVSGANDCTMKIWCLRTMTEIFSCNVGAKINVVAVTDHDEIIVGDVIGRIHIFDIIREL